MTLNVSPALIMHTETTADSRGSTLRAAMDCSAVTTWLATRIVSMHSCGRAAWPPLPSMVMTKRSAAAIIGPGRMANEPTGMPGMLCMP
jgi:hypothetical protein